MFLSCRSRTDFGKEKHSVFPDKVGACRLVAWQHHNTNNVCDGVKEWVLTKHKLNHLNPPACSYFNPTTRSSQNVPTLQVYNMHTVSHTHSVTHKHTHTVSQSSRQCTDLLWVQFVCAALVLVDHVAGRQPVHRGVENGHHHPAGKPLLLPQTVQVTVAHLSMGRPQRMSQQHLTAFSSRVMKQLLHLCIFCVDSKVSLVYFYDLLFTTLSGKNGVPPLNVVIVSLAAIKCLKTVDCRPVLPSCCACSWAVPRERRDKCRTGMWWWHAWGKSLPASPAAPG